MKKNYFSLLIVLLLAAFGTKAFAQAQSDFVSIPGSTTGPLVVIQDVLENDTFQGMPATISNVNFTSVSPTSGYLSLDQNSGSIIFDNGPAPAGTYILGYHFDGIGSFGDYNYAQVIVNVGCDELHAPILESINYDGCGYYGSITLSGLPSGQWWIVNGNNTLVLAQGTGSSVTIDNVFLIGDLSFRVSNYQLCLSPLLTVNAAYLSATVTGTYVDSDSNNVPSVGDTINYTAVLTNTSPCTLTNIVSSGNSPMVGGPLASLAPGAFNNNTFTYTYTLTQSDINAGKVDKYFSFTASTGTVTISTGQMYTNYFNHDDGIKLVAFVDTNSNGIKDGDEEDFNYGVFTYVINNDGIPNLVNASPYHPIYLYETNPATSYDVSFAVYGEYGAYYGLATAAIDNITVPVASGITTYYFPLTFVPYSDTSVTVYGIDAPPRPGFTYKNLIKYTNNGTIDIPSGTLTFTKSNVVSIQGVSVNGTLSNPTGFTYNFNNLMSGESRYITVTMQVPTIPTVALGDLLTNSVSISIPAGDVNPDNNSDTIGQTIVGSYDPNDKTEMHGGKIVYGDFSSNDYLTYKIQFENTGTFPAEFVRVVDVLDDKLDETTVRMVDASHGYTLTRVGKELTWMFDDIQLPPSVENTNIGHGYLVFKVKPKAGYALGDVIPNIANIYFDFNPPIVTEPCVTEFVNSLATDQFGFENFQYAPNPVTSKLTLSNDTIIEKVTVTSLLGQIVLEQAANSLRSEIDFSRLSEGIYIVKVTTQNQQKQIKITKQ